MTDMDKTIKRAFDIAVETHENIAKLIKRCKSLCRESGYEHLKKGRERDFITWFDMIEPRSWSTRWFILPFRRKDSEKKAVYVMEINLYFPRVTVGKFVYEYTLDYSNIDRDIDSYSLPVDEYRDEYLYEEINGFTKATLRANKSWANCIWFTEFPLSEITADNIQEKIFGTFDKLAELKS